MGIVRDEENVQESLHVQFFLVNVLLSYNIIIVYKLHVHLMVYYYI